MSYKHFNTYERGCIEALHKLGYSCRKIAKEVGKHHSTIARELKRNGTSPYKSETAQQAYLKRRIKSKSYGKYTLEIGKLIEEKLLATWSPEQISHTVADGLVSCKTIYNWLYNGLFSAIYMQNLRQKGKRRKIEKRRKFSMGTPISERPDEVKSRKTFGHWELDSMVSSRGESKGCFATFVERKSRLYPAIKTADRTATSMQTAIT